MATIVHISEAASLALHAAVLLAAHQGRPVPVGQAAERLHVSEAHLSKVLQRLAKAGLVKSSRGPHGGYTMAQPAHETTLLDVFEAIEGPLEEGGCLLGTPIADRRQCMLGGLLDTMNIEFRRYLSSRCLSELTSVFADPSASS